MDVKSKILIIGGTGNIGKYLVEASAKAGHPTFALVRESTISDPKRAAIIESFKSLGVIFLHVCCYFFLRCLNSVSIFFQEIIETDMYVWTEQGDLHNHQQLVNAIKQVDIVISAVGGDLVAHQVKIIEAIKEAGNIKVSTIQCYKFFLDFYFLRLSLCEL